ncbi:MAG: hypothetical protein Q8N91_05670 [Candidatus Omnitrophota bacterium]|nr:hypothetical protein [Candidatus Omnitrophota bacterium]
MREVIFKDLTSVTSRKKDIFLKEVFEKDGILTRTERRCFYFIKDMARISDAKDMGKWLEPYSGVLPMAKRNFHVMKEHNDGLGVDKLTCKIAGTFYAVVDNTIYTIGFLHSFKANFMKAGRAE